MLNVRSTALAALTLVLAAALAGCGDDSAEEPDTAATSEHSGDHSESSDPTEPATEESSEAAPTGNVVSVTVVDGVITPEPGKVKIPLGEEVTIEVTSDVAEEVHVHGYDKMIDLEPGVLSSLTLVADIPGIFEAELEGAGTLLFELEVQ